MNEIGKKIKEIRKKKGLSQEELAESAKVNLRTIQRIENNESEPRGKTLNLICEVLDINAEDILDYGKQTDKSYLTIFHLSVIVFLAIPVGNIIPCICDANCGVVFAIGGNSVPTKSIAKVGIKTCPQHEHTHVEPQLSPQ